MNDVRVSTWTELNDLAFERAWNPDIRRHRPTYAFRGLAKTAGAMETSLMQLGGPFAELEHHLLRNFRKYAHATDVTDDNVWNWLTLGQHYGLPTRLLDWTFSPYVAMHFATQDTRYLDTDAAIWCVDFVAAHRYLPDSLRHALEAEGSDLFTVEMLSSTGASLADFDALSEDPFVLFFEPPSLDQRIVNQAALFSVMSNPTALLDDWLCERPDLFFRVLIPAGLKIEVRDKLDQANINERVLFPGLEGLTRWLARYYGPRVPQTVAGAPREAGR